jgi:hypothetical protein
MQASRGAIKVTIISAEALKKKQLDTIQAGVMNFVAPGQTVSLENGCLFQFENTGCFLFRFERHSPSLFFVPIF